MKPLIRLFSALSITLFFLLMALYPLSSRTRADHQLINDQLSAQSGQSVALSQEEALEIARRYLETHQDEVGLTNAQIEGLLLTDYYVSSHSGVTHIYFRERVKGLEVVGSTINLNLTAEGQVFHVGNRIVSCEGTSKCGVEDEIKTALSAVRAVELAAQALGLGPPDSLVVQKRRHNAAQEILLSDGGISQAPIPAKLLYQPLADGTRRLAWALVIHETSGQHWWDVRIDAQTGALLAQDDWVIHDKWQVDAAIDAPKLPNQVHQPANRASLASLAADATGSPQYRVLPWPYISPDEPGASFELLSNPADPIASPFGWHDTDGALGAEFTDTQGNNVLAQEDKSGKDEAGSRPDGGPGLRFDFAFEPALGLVGGSNLEAGIVNLFYWNNLSHDILYHYGFDEQSGNFQQNNYGRGGIGADAVYADGQDSRDVNNAYFGTPPEGQNPRMQLYVWQHTIPNRVGELENSVIVHEYGHGVSTRLTGGGSNVSCLFHDEQMGEGWSDWLGLVMTAKASDTAAQPRSIAPYLLGHAHNGQGVRPRPYTTEMNINPTTYDDVRHLAIPHGVGFVWSTMLWDLYWNLVDQHGFNPNLYEGWQHGGNNLALQLVMDGMKLQPCQPGFVDARDAILSADKVLTGGANQCLIWDTFARRGLGVSATQGSPQSRSDGTEAFDLPASCQFIEATPATQEICVLPKTMLNDSKQRKRNQSQEHTPNPSQEGSQSRNSPLERGWGCVLCQSLDSRCDVCGIDVSHSAPTGQEMLSITVEVGTGFTPPVSLNATSDANNATISLQDDLIQSVPYSTTLIMSPLEDVAAGEYTIAITGTAAQQESATVDFHLFTGTPDTPQLVAPSNQATNIAYQPTFSWQAASQAVQYVLEIDNRASFTSLEHQISTKERFYTLESKLRPHTTYYWRVRAINPCGESSYSATFRFTSKAHAPILLIDEDDNLPDAQPLYRAALEAIDEAYDVWDVSREGEPNEQILAPYEMVIWFTGARGALSAGPNSSSEAALAAYLDNGKCLLISSQTYSSAGQTSFMSGHLGVGSIGRNARQNAVWATEGLFAASDAYTLTYHFQNRSDSLSPRSNANVAFSGDQGTAAIYKDGGYYRTAYFAFPLSALPEHATRQHIMQRVVEWCDNLHTGILNGTVKDADSSRGIAQASVRAKNAHVEQTVSSNASGSYRMVLPVGTYTMTVSESRYVTDTIRYIKIATDTITSQDVVLQGSALSYTPAQLETAVEVGQVITKQITISNTGPLSTSFELGLQFFNGNPAWVEAIPNHGEVGPNRSQTIDLVFNPERLSDVGHYTAWLRFSGTFVNELSVLPIGMQLTCSTCGVLAGQITDHQSGEALLSTIKVSAANGFESTFNDDNYHLTLLPGPYTLTVSAEGYLQQQNLLTVTPNMTHTTDIALIPAFAALEVSPTALSNTLAFDKQLTDTLMIRNLGTINLDFDLALNHVEGENQANQVTWVTVLSDSGSVPPNSVHPVEVRFDATSPALLLNSSTTNPVGIYAADLTISGNFTSTTIPLTMPLTCGDCVGLSGSIRNAVSAEEISATVQLINAKGIVFSQEEVLTYTQLVLPDTYTMTVQAAGYFSQTEVITVEAGATMSNNWQLMPIFAQLSTSVTEVQQLMERDQQRSKSLLLSNTGSIPLTYVIAAAAAPSSCNLPYTINGDFEEGNFSNWHITGGWFMNDGSYERVVDGQTIPPLADTFSAISDQRGDVLATLYQDVALPTTLPSKMTFSWIDQWENGARWFDDDQEFRVELYGPGGTPFLGELFSTDGSYPNLSQATRRDVDVTELIRAYAGQSVRLQFVVESQDYFLNVQVDTARCDEHIAWISTSPQTGTIRPFSSTTIDLIFDTQAITQTGTHHANLIFGSNSTYAAPLLPLKMQVVEEVEDLYLPLGLR